MPRIAGTSLATPVGDLAATLAALDAGVASTAPLALPGGLVETLIRIGNEALAGARPDLVVFATTKGDLGPWCDSLISGAGYAGGPAQVATELGKHFAAPAFAVSAACASSPIACGVAARWLASGRARRVLVLAGDRIGPFISDGFAALRALDPTGSHPFDAERAGLALGEVAGAVVLSADDDGGSLHLQGWGASLDANHLTGPTRDGSGVSRACNAAIARAGDSPLALIVAHGTGTRYNDDSESLAYAATCPRVPVTAIKGLLGHSLGACGLAEFAIAAAARARGATPGTVNLRQQGCAGAITVLPPGVHALAAGSILSANAGFGGINGVVVIGDRPAPARAAVRARLRRRIDMDARGWRHQDETGTWREFGDDGLPRMTALEIIGRVDPMWGRMDLACRALIVLAMESGELPADTGVVLLTEAGCAASDRSFERNRRERGADPQRFPYTLPSAPVGELSIRLRITGPGCTILGASDDQGRAIAQDLIADGCPAVLLARVEADRSLSAWAETWVADR
ncbi:MAG: hypothetical protein H0V44_13265 [Planctomycetes bacterium]|nr:hypothetical protein [Planctomycetota bacterium]